MTTATKRRTVPRNQNPRNGGGVKQTMVDSPVVQSAGDVTRTSTEQVSPDLLRILQSARAKLAMAQVSADSILQEIVELYQLGQGDNLDIQSGAITRKAKEK